MGKKRHKIKGTSSDDVLVGTAGADDIDGRHGNDAIDGSAGSDRLRGSKGDDTLSGGLGNDKLDGGAGSDWADYRDAPGGVTVNLAITQAQDTKSAGIDTLISIENLWGSSDLIDAVYRHARLNDGLFGAAGAE